MVEQTGESNAPARPEHDAKRSGGRRWFLFGGIGCAGILGLCVVFALVAALVGDDNDDTPADRNDTQAVEQESSQLDSDDPGSSGEEAEEGDPEPTETSAANTEEAPTPTEIEEGPTPTTEDEPDPEPDRVGAGRSNPVPLGEIGSTEGGDWEVRVNQVFRGEDAWQRILDANQFNEPAREGMEYVLIDVTVAYLGDEAEAQNISTWDFTSTGDARVRWSLPAAVSPEPELQGDLFSGGELSGWVVLAARTDETNLIAIYEPPFSLEEGDEIFLALDEGASVEPLMERSVEVNDVGTDRSTPAPLGERVVGEIWEVWLIEAIRGDQAWQMVQEANQFNEPPMEGMEYIVAHVGARNVKGGHGSDSISSYMFATTGDSNLVHDLPSAVDPEPELNYQVYAGGEVSGWIVLQSQVGENNVSAVFQENVFGGDTRYLAIE